MIAPMLRRADTVGAALNRDVDYGRTVVLSRYRSDRIATAFHREKSMTTKIASIVFLSATAALYGTSACADFSINETLNTAREQDWSIKEPIVTQADTSYQQVQLKPGDTFKITDVGGCVQTGGHGATWKRYVDPSGDNSDHLYHGTIRLPGMSSSMRIGDFKNANPGGYVIPNNASGDMSLHLGYEDDNYSDNGYYSHDNGNNDQCKNSVNAYVLFSVKIPAPRPTLVLTLNQQRVVAGPARILVPIHAKEEAIAVKPESMQAEQKHAVAAPAAAVKTTEHETLTETAKSAVQPLPKPLPHPLPVGPFRVTLSWTSTNANSCQWTNVLSGSAPVNGSLGVEGTNGMLVAGTYDYKLTCTGDGGSVSDHQVLTVTPAPPTINLSVNPSSIPKGGTATLTWTTANANTCHADGELGWSGAEPLNGSQTVSPTLVGAHLYKLSCNGDGLTSTVATATLNVTTPPAPTVSIQVSPASVAQGTAATLTWSSANATSCTASGGELNWSGSEPVNGSQSVKPLTKGAHTYKLTCSGDGGSTANLATLTVN
jgi:hypothetical protein